MITYNDSARDVSKTPDVKYRLGKLILLNFLELDLISEDEFRTMRDKPTFYAHRGNFLRWALFFCKNVLTRKLGSDIIILHIKLGKGDYYGKRRDIKQGAQRE